MKEDGVDQRHQGRWRNSPVVALCLGLFGRSHQRLRLLVFSSHSPLSDSFLCFFLLLICNQQQNIVLEF